jgi:hypothetical protein
LDSREPALSLPKGGCRYVRRVGGEEFLIVDFRLMIDN